jgi:hypothetical protein
MHSPGPLNSAAGPAERLFSAPLCGALSYPADGNGNQRIHWRESTSPLGTSQPI